MKLEVGMYVRTELYSISKIIDMEDLEWIEIDKNKGYLIHRDTILKASHNIIDLIEVGDYVNGKLVSKVSTDYIFDYSEQIKIIYFSEKDYIYSTKDIKSIVTKEQFSQMEYKVD